MTVPWYLSKPNLPYYTHNWQHKYHYVHVFGNHADIGQASTACIAEDRVGISFVSVSMHKLLVLCREL